MPPVFFQMQNSLLFFGGIFKRTMLPGKSEKPGYSLLGYDMFKHFSSVYGVWNAVLENVQFA